MAATTATRNNVVFVRATHHPNRIQQIKEHIVQTMNIGDTVMLIDLNSCSESSCFNIYKATVLKHNIDLISTTTVESTPWRNNHYDIIENSLKYFFTQANNSTLNAVILVSDSVPSSSSLEKALNSASSFHPKLVSIIISSDEVGQLKSYSCSSSGILVEDQQRLSVFEMMKPYNQYFNQGIDLDKSRWSTIYDDLFNFGTVATVTYPLPLNGKLMGAVGMDVSIDYIVETFNITKYEAYAELTELELYSDFDGG